MLVSDAPNFKNWYQISGGSRSRRPFQHCSMFALCSLFSVHLPPALPTRSRIMSVLFVQDP